MNILMTTDGYHLTMGYLIAEDALKLETHILYARTGGATVIADIDKMIANYIKWKPTVADVNEAETYWTSQGVPFHTKALVEIAKMKTLPITIFGVREGEVVRPGDPVAIVRAPAVIAALAEPLFIGDLMYSSQVATRFTKTACALSWERHRVFEVGMRADRVESHEKSVQTLADVGLLMSSSGNAAQKAGIKAGGSMGHRYTQRFESDYEAFDQAVDRMLEFKKDKGITGKVKLSLLLDTRNTLNKGLPDAIRVIQERYEEIKENIDLSVRLDSGDLRSQLKVIIGVFKNNFNVNEFMPSIIVESGLTAQDIYEFEQIAQDLNFPRGKMLYGQGGYLVGGISRDFLSMVYKVSSVDGVATMKFSDEMDNGKESYPGDITLMQLESNGIIQRKIVLVDEVSEYEGSGWINLFEVIAKEGEMVRTEIDKETRIKRIESNWEKVALSYVGDEKRPDIFPKRPDYSQGVSDLVNEIKQTQLSELKNSNLISDSVFL